MGFADPARVRRLMEQHELDGLLAVTPENFTYWSGLPYGPIAGMWRRAGPVSAVVRADGATAFVVPDSQAAATRQANPQSRVYEYTVWIERVEVDPTAPGDAATLIARATADRRLARPETFDWDAVTGLLRDALNDLGLLGRRVGLELEFAPAADVERLRAALAPTQFVNSSHVIREIRAVKTQREIDLMRTAVELTETGIVRSLDGLNEQTLAADIIGRYAEAASAAARERRLLGFESARTTVHLGPALWGRGDPRRPAHRGDTIQFDSGVRLGGYSSDIGRTFTFGPPSQRQQQIQRALLAGFAAGLAELRPGRRFCDVFHATEAAVHANGFPTYTRGHFGHSMGGDLGSEEWPFISAREQTVLEPGMVLAFEVPYYVDGIGGFQNEDNLLITERGHGSFNRLPLDLTAVG